KIPAAGYKIEGLWISGIDRKLSLRNLSFPFKLMSSLIKAKRIIKKFNPDAVIGTGGFASGPVLYAASSEGIPTLIQEQNSYPGITNKILGKKVNKICVAYSDLDRFFPEDKIVLTGNPIRKELLDSSTSTVDAKDSFNLKHGLHTLLVLGGSLGARRINTLIEENLEFFQKNEVQLVWQCGKLYYDEYKIYNQHENVQVHKFLDDMEKAYSAADIIISRAGASSVSELCIVGKPVIFIPSPNVAEDHQTKNAEAIVKENAAILLKEEHLEETFQHEFINVIKDKDLRDTLSENIKELAKKNATSEIVDEIEKLITKRKIEDKTHE
ncbi:MAG: undecaprenyldiphospho-muramoylpentapeptide beta-N-acetylglucosaminyltransferase, partial [Flavobacteriaceae bacterium]|nr:undecaprenyldiphospho-muramoylpentapeptide beta-N-acetylglucosaminyltransferase [Flavobacteriaceae bacterium]